MHQSLFYCGVSPPNTLQTNTNFNYKKSKTPLGFIPYQQTTESTFNLTVFLVFIIGQDRHGPIQKIIPWFLMQEFMDLNYDQFKSMTFKIYMCCYLACTQQQDTSLFIIKMLITIHGHNASVSVFHQSSNINVGLPTLVICTSQNTGMSCLTSHPTAPHTHVHPSPCSTHDP